MKSKLLVNLISSLLIILWVYAALSKLFNIDRSRMEMMNQVFPAAISRFLLWAIPIVELFGAALLSFSSSRKPGLALSVVLLFLFSTYILLVYLNVFERVPCSCGGVISKLGWGEHLVFNLAFLGLALLGFHFQNRKEVIWERE